MTDKMNAFIDQIGLPGAFLGLPAEFAEYENSKIVLLPVPFDLTTSYGKGSDNGPKAIVEASRQLEVWDEETKSEVYRLGIHTAEPVEAATSEAMLRDTERRVSECLDAGKFVFVIGGEHSITPAPVRAHAKKFGNIGVLQIDAHPDLRQTFMGSPLSHACAMARVLDCPQVSTIAAVGIRSVGPEEIDQTGRVKTWYAHDLRKSSTWISEVVKALPQKVYITVDLDGFDPSIMPSTGTPQPGGLSWYQGLDLLSTVIREREVIGMDMVELAPVHGVHAPDFMAAKLLYRMLSYKFGNQALVANPT